ncbi:hypothetical protein MKX03_025975 [Papaver bracteatum]|nr:hypothetical protein MKX03_025975 [Papaver bracteatum]
MHYQQGFSYYCFSFLFFYCITLLPLIPARNMPAVATNILSVNPNTNHPLSGFLDTGRGNDINGLSELKKYFHRFGYLSKHGLPTNGRLDSATLSQVMSPRCGVPDNDDHNNLRHTTEHYSFLTGWTNWNRSTVPLMLTYALSREHIINYINIPDILVALERAFSTWSSVIPVTFTETQNYKHANITITHTWAVDFNSEKSENAYDLETTAIHEIGHVLGMNHSNIREAVMWLFLGHPRTKHVDLALDDVNGVQVLYDATPNFKLDFLKVKKNTLVVLV